MPWAIALVECESSGGSTQSIQSRITSPPASGTRARLEKPTRRAASRPAKQSPHMTSAPPLRALKKPSVSSGSAPSAKANRSRRSRRPSTPERVGERLSGASSARCPGDRVPAEAWSVTGEADAIARVRTSDNADLERLIIDLQRDGLVERTRSQVVLSRLVRHGRD